MKKVIGYVLGAVVFVVVPDDFGVEIEKLKDVDGKVVDCGVVSVEVL